MQFWEPMHICTPFNTLGMYNTYLYSIDACLESTMVHGRFVVGSYLPLNCIRTHQPHHDSHRGNGVKLSSLNGCFHLSAYSNSTMNFTTSSSYPFGLSVAFCMCVCVLGSLTHAALMTKRTHRKGIWWTAVLTFQHQQHKGAHVLGDQGHWSL